MKLLLDENIPHQQNFEKYPITVFVFHTESNDYNTLKPLIELIASKIEAGLKIGPVVIP